MASTTSSGPRARSGAASGRLDRRTLLLSGAVLAAVIVGGVALVAVTTDDGPRRDTEGQLQEQGGVKPHIIPRPNEGQAPTDGGDRGGWEQLTLFGILVVAIAGIGAAVFRGGRTAQANRAAWRAAAATGRDGVVGDRIGPARPTDRPSAEPSPAARRPGVPARGHGPGPDSRGER